jgi:hypothetical protein
VKAEPQASVAVATANTGVAGQSIVEVAGKAAITEPYLVIVCEAVDELPHESVAVQVLVTEYEPAHEPLVVTSAEVNVKQNHKHPPLLQQYWSSRTIDSWSLVRLQSLEPFYLVR